MRVGSQGCWLGRPISAVARITQWQWVGGLVLPSTNLRDNILGIKCDPSRKTTTANVKFVNIDP